MSTSFFKVTEHVIPAQHIREFPYATANRQEDVLRLAVKQYTPLDNLNPKDGDLTILGGHANAFPKELYEPLWDELFKLSKAKGFRIRNIWIADVAHQGHSSVINENLLGNDPSWFDHPRDLLGLVNHFRSSFVRPIIGVGHSMGGAHLVQLSLNHPRLLSSLILIDPVMQRFTSPRGTGGPAQASSRRRDIWPSRNDAHAGFARSKFYQTWDPRVLALWEQHGLRDLPTKVHPAAERGDPRVTLTTSKHQEVFTFLRETGKDTSRAGFTVAEKKRVEALLYPDFVGGGWEATWGFYRPEPIQIFASLPFVRPSVLYVFGDESDLSAPDLRADKMAATGTGLGGSGGEKAGRVKEVVVKNVGHLIPMIKVMETAGYAADWIGDELKRWRADEALLKRQWNSLPDEEKYMLGKTAIGKFGKAMI
ncbi:alpha/beta-hydrolase [Microthyrium microscopicum]|uniref:Alpha/beta-hydrolase n=1 Tax=Microthyrium microscopicum TaxID=703497 RepID=A0A6A6UAP0_9PEZI|nr:alpha/beta-hydrolase [Microthyrium microscopicum]